MSEEPNSPGTSNPQDDQLGRWLLVFGLLLVAAAVILYTRYQRSQPVQPQVSEIRADTETTPPAQSIRGQAAPDFSLADLHGKIVSRSDFRNKVVLVNFWATWCAPCLVEIPWFIEFQKQYGPKGFQVVAISMDEDGEKVVPPFVEKHGMKDLAVLLGKPNTPDAFGGILGLPTTFIIDRDGKFYSKHQGLVNREDVEMELAELMGGATAPGGGTKSGTSQSSTASGPAELHAGIH